MCCKQRALADPKVQARLMVSGKQVSGADKLVHRGCRTSWCNMRGRKDRAIMNDRRDFLKTAAAAFTTSIFTGNVRGANDRIRVAFIGMGRMGTDSMQTALKLPNVEVPTVCDVYQPNLEKAVAVSGRGPDGTPDARPKAKGITDFREILADKSIDVVNISTPDHWHAYMTVEACKNGKDVYVEKPICVAIEEGRKMVQAARKYDRVVQVGTWQRSGEHFQKAAEIVRSGKLGKVTFVRTWNYGHQKPEGIGNPPDAEPPADLDWDMWLGPAPQRAFNKNRFGVDPNAVFVLPLVLGLRRRHDDRLGHSPARHRADGVQRNGADDHRRHGRKIVSAGQSRDPGHAAGDVPISQRNDRDL